MLGVSFAANQAGLPFASGLLASPCNMGVCAGSVTLGLWAMRGTCHVLLEFRALEEFGEDFSLVKNEEAYYIILSQTVMAMLVCTHGPRTSPCSAITSLHALIEYHAADKQMLFHPLTLVGYHRVNLLASFPSCHTCLSLWDCPD